MTNISARQYEERKDYLLSVQADAIENLKNIKHISIGKDKYRLFRCSVGELCVFAKGSTRKGRPLARLFEEVYTESTNPPLPVIVYENPKADWEKSINKCEKLLVASGLHQEFLKELQYVKEIGYDNLQRLRAIEFYANPRPGEKYSASIMDNQDLLRSLYREGATAIIEDQDGLYCLDQSKLWHFYTPLKIKTMYFGKYDNAEKLAEIADALKNKKEIYITGRSNYDVSFRYDPVDNLAFYSEEFRDCGNGHYYLAIDATHAVHYEDD